MDSTQTGSTSASVKIKVFGGLRDVAGGGSLDLSWSKPVSVSQLLEELSRSRPALVVSLRRGLTDGYLNILVNGRNARFLDGMETLIHAGDTVAFLPPVGGG